MISREMRPTGQLTARKIGATRAPWSWRLKNAARWAYLKGAIAFHVIRPLAASWGLLTMIASLSIRVKRADGSWEDYGVVSHRVITTAGVTYLRDDFNNNAQDITLMNFHGCGTTNTAEAVGDTALAAESTTALNPDNTRATGTRSTPSATVFRSVGTLTFDATAAVVEHGILSQAATGGGTLWDRSVFSAINVASGDSIQFTYDLTLTAGG